MLLSGISSPSLAMDGNDNGKKGTSSKLRSSSDSSSSTSHEEALTFKQTRILAVNTDTPIRIQSRSPLYEMVMSGEQHGCAVYSLGFSSQREARDFLLSHSKNSTVRKLVEGELRADLVVGGVASQSIATDVEYQTLSLAAEINVIGLWIHAFQPPPAPLCII